MRTSPLMIPALACLIVACGDDDEPKSDADATTSDTTDVGPPPEPILLKTTATSTIGVLLDELPEGAVRDRVANDLIAEDDTFWIERAKTQLGLTHYRLTFRAYFYDEEEGKRSLNLPPPEVWNITLADGGPVRTTIDGHDYVAVAYTLDSMVISDGATPLESDPAFAAIGGIAEETFVLPADPELVLQRTGYACIDEAEFPPDSVDAENVATYFDDGCEAIEDPEIPIKERCHASEPLPTEDCVDALENHIGRADLTLTFERIAYDAEIAAPFRIAAWTSETGTDVIPVAEALDRNYIVYKYIPPDDCALVEKCVGAPGWRRLLRFDAFLKNTGKVDMEIGDVDYFIVSTSGSETLLGRHNIFEYSACHDHYHFKHYGNFTLDVGDEQVSGSKRAFCLETGTRHFNDEHTPTVTEYSGCHFQGLTHGWGDEYGANLDCQWYDITEVDATGGVAAEIGFHANPDGFLCEGNPVLDEDGQLTFTPTEFTTDDGEPVDMPVCEYIDAWDSNNLATRATTIPPTGGLVTAPCTRGQIGPKRDCGFEADVISPCVAGAAIKLRCSNDGTEPALVRLCEASAKLGTGVACVFRDALGNSIVPADDSVEIALTCPAARDEEEPGGQFSIYRAPLVGGDALDVACELLPNPQ